MIVQVANVARNRLGRDNDRRDDRRDNYRDSGRSDRRSDRDYDRGSSRRNDSSGEPGSDRCYNCGEYGKLQYCFSRFVYELELLTGFLFFYN